MSGGEKIFVKSKPKNMCKKKKKITKKLCEN